MKLVIQLVLWAVIGLLAYMLYTSVNAPVKFNEIKTARYKKVISNLKDIRSAELAYQEIVGGFIGDFDSLVRFIDTAQFAIVERRDTSYADVEKNKAFGLDPYQGGYIKEAVILDTLGYASVKDSIYHGTERYKTMMNLPIEGIEGKIDLDAGMYDKSGVMYSVFEAKVSKEVVLDGLDKDLINQEKQQNSVDGVRGAFISVGAMDDVDTGGNWSKLFDSGGKQ